MPLYDFRCPTCGHEQEAMQSYASAAPDCAECGQATERFVSGFAVARGVGRERPDFSKIPFDKQPSCGVGCGCARH